MDPIELEIFKGLLSAIPEEMGIALRRSSFSANIKERLDFSCALFDAQARMIAQAAHIPVHLGAMPLSVRACLDDLQLGQGDVAILNDPFRGGTHLPDITLVSPIFLDKALIGFAANRAHHADVGGISPGSMTISTDVSQEGVLIPPSKLVVDGQLDQEWWQHLLSEVRTPDERAGDLRAQMAANRIGVERMLSLIDRYGHEVIQEAILTLLEYTERLTRELLHSLPDGVYRFRDQMDDDGVSKEPAAIEVAISIKGGEARIDFEGSSAQREGSINAVYAIAVSAVHYVFRCLLGSDVPSNSGAMEPIEVIAPEGSLVNARPPAAVAGGNVETSQRIVDVLLGALAEVFPQQVPAASQGTMNNLTIGGWDSERQRPFAYYETIAGGAGAAPYRAGTSAIHTHMTNTLNTPVEAIEYEFPLRVERYSVRSNSRGAGRFDGGEGVIRELELQADAEVAILSDRRRFGPYGLADGEEGRTGRNLLIVDGREEVLSGKVNRKLRAGDRIRIETPGGGGYGKR